MRSRLFLLTAVAAVMSCAAVAETETPVSHAVGVDRPAWFRAAVAESAHLLQFTGCEKAPLEIVDTADPLWKACIVETAEAAEVAQQRVYVDALSECIEWRGVEPQCCFARVTNEPSRTELRRERCEAECRAKRVAGRTYRAAPKCQSEVMVHSVDLLRFRTPMVDSILAGCATGDADDGACASLPTRVERTYCIGGCAPERTYFLNSLRECTDRVKAGLPTSCEHLFADKPLAPAATMIRRKAECERRCSASLPPL